MQGQSSRGDLMPLSSAAEGKGVRGWQIQNALHSEYAITIAYSGYMPKADAALQPTADACHINPLPSHYKQEKSG